MENGVRWCLEHWTLVSHHSQKNDLHDVKQANIDKVCRLENILKEQHEKHSESLLVVLCFLCMNTLLVILMFYICVNVCVSVYT